MRDFLILTAPDNAPDQIARVFASSLRFRWSSDLNDIYTSNPHNSGLYTFSNRFLTRFDDLMCWALESDFFEFYPELIGYVPMYNAGPERPFSNPQGQANHLANENARREASIVGPAAKEQRSIINGVAVSSSGPDWWNQRLV